MVMAIGAAIAHSSQLEAATGAVPCPASASVAHLNVNGTAMVASFAASKSTTDPITRSFRSRRSEGQM
jgi:hypothetical protein